MRTIKKEIIPNNFKKHGIYEAIKKLEPGYAVEISPEEWVWQSKPYSLVYINFPELRGKITLRIDKQTGNITVARYR